jgi:hypothetical protein
LKFPTTDGGGLITEHKGVYQDDEALTISDSLATVATGPNQTFIIGSAGASIIGYTDTPTLVADGFVTLASQAAELLRRTANHVVVSLAGTDFPPDEPTNHVYAASYVIRGDSGTKDITSTGVEFVDLGNFTITFRDATAR